MNKYLGTLAIGLAATSLLAFSAPGYAGEDLDQQRIEVAFVLDTTGSMAGLIDGAKRKIWSIANTIVDIHPGADIKMSIIGYRDIGDDYVLKTFDMSSDLQGLYGNLIAFQAQGGGDRPESVNEALDASIRTLNWSADGKDAERIVFLVGDAPPHMDYANAPKYPDVITRANKRGIIINAVQAGGDSETRQIWQDIARLGKGNYIQIPQDGGTIVIIETPFDGDIIILQKRLDKTVIPYGTRYEQDAVRDKMSIKSSASDEVQIDNSRFYSKRSHKKEVITGGGDLVADLRNGTMSVDKIDADMLPEDLQALSAPQQTAYVESNLATRIELEETMKNLIEKRDLYVAEASKTEDGADSFDKVVGEILREQLK